MTRTRVRATAVATVAAIALLATAGVAGAESVSCRFSASGVLDPPMVIVGGSGTYTFQSSAGQLGETVCSRNGGPSLRSTIFSRGVFENAVCAGGFATLESDNERRSIDETKVDVGGDGTFEVTALRYRTDIVAATGTTQARGVNGNVIEEGGAPEGVVAFRPQHSCTFQPLTHFTLDGVLELAW